MRKILLQNGQTITKIGTLESERNATQISMSASDITTVAEKINEVETNISEVNDSLSEVTDRGYLTSKSIESGDTNDLMSGEYFVNGFANPKVVNLPPNPVNSWWHIKCIRTSNYVWQEAIDASGYKKYQRICNEGAGWTPWQEIATMDKVLPLTGGTVNNLTINRTSNPNLYIKHADADKMGYTTILFLLDNGSSSLRNTIQDGTYASLILSKSNSRDSALMLGRSADPAYKIYGEHNITVSQTAPSTTLPNGCMHNVY